MNGRNAALLVLGVGAVAFLAPSALGGSVSPQNISAGGAVPPNVLRWGPLAQKYAQINAALEPEEILAIVWSESTGNPAAVNPDDPSWGLMQVTSNIARAFGGFTTDLGWQTDPEKNMKAGAAFLAYLKTNYETDFPLTNPSNAWVNAYNQGEGNLRAGRDDISYATAFISHLASLQGVL